MFNLKKKAQPFQNSNQEAIEQENYRQEVSEKMELPYTEKTFEILNAFEQGRIEEDVAIVNIIREQPQLTGRIILNALSKRNITMKDLY